MSPSFAEIARFDSTRHRMCPILCPFLPILCPFLSLISFALPPSHFPRHRMLLAYLNDCLKRPVLIHSKELQNFAEFPQDVCEAVSKGR